MQYDPHYVEKKWQKYWQENKSFQAREGSSPKYYVLDMFPYPSGAGLHVGHLIGYTATDVVARYKRAKGFRVLHPMGWDSFGLPAEQYAIRTGTHPRVTTLTNTKRYKEQLLAMGYSYDWDREIMTSEPDYYKWTQYLFTKLYDKGLAYQAELLVNYCPALGTVLANEEVEEGFAKEGGHPIERRPLRQWVLKITEYADRLLEDLEALDWPIGLKKLQSNWIGRSEGAQIHFPLVSSSEKIAVFTTVPQTLFGATYLVLAPEHPLLSLVTTQEHKEQVEHYCKEAARKSDLERTELAKDKTGVFTGGYAINIATEEKIPIWVADYVLGHYGTAAVMGVPAHDERDFLFAQNFDLPFKAVVSPEDPEIQKELFAKKRAWTKEGTIIASSTKNFDLNGSSSTEAKNIITKWLQEQGFGIKSIHYKLRDWLFSRQRYWGEPIPVLHFEDGTTRALALDELPLTPPEITDFSPDPKGLSPLSRNREWVEIIDPITRKKAYRETNTMPQWAGSCWYYLRFIDPHNQNEPWSKEKERAWMPVDLYIGGAEHAVLHLLYARFWHKVFYDCQMVSTKEPFQKLTNQGLVLAESFKRKDGHYVPESEVVRKEDGYFHWQTKQPLECQIEKMSKSKLNGKSPDEIIKEFGADALRLYALFMGPIEKEKIWKTENISGPRRFLNRFFDFCTKSEIVTEEALSLRLAHRLAYGVELDLEQHLFNTALAKMMEFLNECSKLSQVSLSALLIAVRVLEPLAPHLAEELWQHLGQKPSISKAPWPKIDPQMLEEDQVTYVVQVDGKLRKKLSLPKDQTKEALFALVQKDEHIATYLKTPVDKLIFVPNKLLNIVLKK